MRKRIYQMVHVYEGNFVSVAYKYFMIAVIAVSLIPLTTVGYGDIYPVTVLGRTVAMISSFFGIAIVALPAGIVTAEYLGALKENERENCDCSQADTKEEKAAPRKAASPANMGFFAEAVPDAKATPHPAPIKPQTPPAPLGTYGNSV